MALNAEQKKTVVDAYATAPGDTGSPEVQVALLTSRINELTAHLPTISTITTPVVGWCVWSTPAASCWIT